MEKEKLREHASLKIAEPEAIVDREAGLHRGLNSRQIAMIGLGCTIGTGLFLGSAISVTSRRASGNRQFSDWGR